MFKYLIFITLILSFLSCSSKNNDINIQKGIRSDTSNTASSVLLATPQIIDSSHIVIYPLILEKTTSGGGISSSYSSEKLSYWNLIFYNSDNKTQHLLVKDKKIVIHAIKRSDSHSSSSDNFWANGINIFKSNIFYEVVSKDFNQNNLLDDADPTYLCVSDKQGFNFRPLSPDNFNIVSWEVIKGTTKIILQGQKDANGDKKIDSNDPLIPLMVDISTGQLASEVFNKAYIDSLQSILTSTWQVEKK